MIYFISYSAITIFLNYMWEEVIVINVFSLVSSWEIWEPGMEYVNTQDISFDARVWKDILSQSCTFYHLTVIINTQICFWKLCVLSLENQLWLEFFKIPYFVLGGVSRNLKCILLNIFS